MLLLIEWTRTLSVYIAMNMRRSNSNKRKKHQEMITNMMRTDYKYGTEQVEVRKRVLRKDRQSILSPIMVQYSVLKVVYSSSPFC